MGANCRNTQAVEKKRTPCSRVQTQKTSASEAAPVRLMRRIGYDQSGYNKEELNADPPNGKVPRGSWIKPGQMECGHAHRAQEPDDIDTNDVILAGSGGAFRHRWLLARVFLRLTTSEASGP